MRNTKKAIIPYNVVTTPIKGDYCMHILTHSFNEIYKNILTDTLKNSIDTMISPINFNPTVFNYTNLISNIDIYVRAQGVNILKNILEKMDHEIRTLLIEPLDTIGLSTFI